MDTRWKELGAAFLRAVGDDGEFLLSEFREALAIHGVKAPKDSDLVNWIKEQGWGRKPKKSAYSGHMWIKIVS